MDTTTTARGRLGEEIAATYLELVGYRVRRRNLRVGRLEIDLVATRGRLVVFVEVKLRSSRRAGRAAEAVNRTKSRRLIEAATRFTGQLRRRGYRVRLDVVGIELEGSGLRIIHYPGAVTPPTSFVT